TADDVYDATLLDSGPGDGPAPRRRKRKKRRKGRSGIAVAPWVIRAAVGLGIAVFLVVLVVVGVRAIFHPSPPPEIAAHLWRPFQVPGRCKLLFPGSPTQQSQNLGGLTMVMYQVEPDKDSVFGLGYTEGQLPPERRFLPVEQLLNDACNGCS